MALSTKETGTFLKAQTFCDRAVAAEKQADEWWIDNRVKPID